MLNVQESLQNMAAWTLQMNVGQPSIYHATVAHIFSDWNLQFGPRTKSSFLATSLYKKVIFTKNWVTRSCRSQRRYVHSKPLAGRSDVVFWCISHALSEDQEITYVLIHCKTILWSFKTCMMTQHCVRQAEWVAWPMPSPSQISSHVISWRKFRDQVRLQVREEKMRRVFILGDLHLIADLLVLD